MRVTSNTFPNTLVDQLAQLNTRQYRLQAQAASGQRLRLPEDDPAGMQRVLNLQTEAKGVAQYSENIARLQETAQANYQIMRSLKRISDRAGELAVLADGMESPGQLQLYAIEVTQLIKEAVQIANTKFNGEYLLSGTRTGQSPFALTTDGDGRVVAVDYQGNAGFTQSEIAENVAVSAGVLGANLGGAGPRGLLVDSRFGADFFNHLISLQNHLLAGDTDAIAGVDRAALALDEENMLLHFGDNGALQARLEASLSLSRQRSENLEAQVSRSADVDLAAALVRLTQTQNAYQAALQSGAQLLSRSLLDFLE